MVSAVGGCSRSSPVLQEAVAAGVCGVLAGSGPTSVHNDLHELRAAVESDLHHQRLTGGQRGVVGQGGRPTHKLHRHLEGPLTRDDVFDDVVPGDDNARHSWDDDDGLWGIYVTA